MSNNRLTSLSAFVGNALAGSLLVIYTYVHFFDVAHPGFIWDPRTGAVLSSHFAELAQPGDRLIQVDATTLAEFLADQRLRLFPPAGEAETVRLVLERNGVTRVVDWRLPGLSWETVLGRLWNQWFLAWIFWAFGFLTLLLVRPRDARWRLLIAFCNLAAVNLITSVAARDHAAESAIVGRIVIWLSVPVNWHLHWIFPEPLWRVPRGVWPSLYLAAGVIAALEWLQLPPTHLYLYGFLLAMSGIVGPLGLRLFRPRTRWELRVLWLAALAAIGPTLILGAAALLAPKWPAEYGTIGVLLGWPLLPALYFYAAYRKQLGNQETRANRAISVYLFLTAFFFVLAVLLTLIDQWLPFEQSPDLSVALAAGAGGVIALAAYGPFQRWASRFLLRIRLPPAQLTSTYTARLTASPDYPSLTRLLRDDILPSLMVRQSALLRLDEDGQPHVLYAHQAPQIPTRLEIPNLLADADRYRLPPELTDTPPVLSWARLILPLRVMDQTIGVWLLGRRDPDDLYTQDDVTRLRALADQTAIALTHLLQTENLRRLYQANIDRDEQERNRLARELHDDILSELALLAPGRDERAPDPAVQTAFEHAVRRVRQMISGLRVTMLTYGLRGALEQLGDDLAERTGDHLTVSVRLEGEARYPAPIELHLFRIAQQAGENAVKHAGARHLCFSVRLEAGLAEIVIEDDGRGLPPEALGDLSTLIERRHFGLAGMRERAALIGGSLQVESPPEGGTRIRVTWQPTSA